MSTTPSPRIAECFADLVDPRIDRTKRHRLLEIVTIALCGVRCGAESWVEVGEWGDAKRAWLATWLARPNGIPSHHAFGRVFSRIDPAQFEAGSVRWAQGVAAQDAGSVVAVDGKTGRAAREHGGRARHLVSAWASANRPALGQEAVDGRSNEITAIPALLARLDRQEQAVTIDAMGCQRAVAAQIVARRGWDEATGALTTCQRAVAAQIVAQGGDHVLAPKANQPDLLTNVADGFRLATEGDPARTVSKGHGRIGVRPCRTITDPAVPAWLDPEGAWPGLRSTALVEAERRIDAAVASQPRYYPSSLPGEAPVIAAAVRGHWGIENQVHWVLEVALRADANRSRLGHRAENLALRRKPAPNLLRVEPTRTHGVKARRLRAGWDNASLLRVLGSQYDAMALPRRGARQRFRR